HQVAMAACAAVSDVDRVFYAVTSRTAVEDGVAALAGYAGQPYRLPRPGELPVTDDAEISTAVRVTEALPAKLGALRAHATQISVWQGAEGERCYALSNSIAQPVLDEEYYVLARGPRTGVETDLFGGLGLAEAPGVRS
ncbi:MAG TPA: N-acetyl-1-D-myo-inositol-2-amino-2-deoxy-alpha-D-glucopyranoside deacetylase, partial [Micromonosporaceae bacterium]|nr:N-acetyl-1-D-myo-inositol-2-amino-2-deoxy-alpha-D-glucopyranoside deacetylase [Micromonosporaceae bacterium]